MVAKPLDGDAPKKSELVANRILQDIIDMGWPVGTNLGGEADLYTRYQVSRDIFREAVRRVERDGFAVMRRGVNGGLIVTAPAEDGVINALTNYLEIADISIDEIIETQDILERLVIDLATERLDDAGIAALDEFRKGLDVENSSIHQLSTWLLKLQAELARQTHNTSIVLFLEPLVYFTIDYLDLRRMPKAVYRDLNRKGSEILIQIVNAIVARNVSKATFHLGELLKLMRQEVFVASPSSRPRALATGGPQAVPLRHELRQKRENKAAEALALRISSHIQRKRLQPGDRLGAELDLLDKFDTCRSTFREAIRILESVSRVRTKRGKGGGLSVATPDPRTTVDLTATYLQYIKFELTQLLEVRLILECCAAECAAKRASEDEKMQLLKALEEEEQSSLKDFTERANELRSRILQCSHNRVLYFYCEILNELVLRQFVQAPGWKGWKNVKEVTGNSHHAVVRAIVEGDAALAYRRMYEHRRKADDDLYLSLKKTR